MRGKVAKEIRKISKELFVGKKIDNVDKDYSQRKAVSKKLYGHLSEQKPKLKTSKRQVRIEKFRAEEQAKANQRKVLSSPYNKNKTKRIR